MSPYFFLLHLGCMTCHPPQFFLKKKNTDDTSLAEANNALSDLVYILATVLTGKSGLKFFLPKNSFSTHFDPKDL
jgi:hypothetical protein